MSYVVVRGGRAGRVQTRPDIFFLQVPEPKVSKNRLHLDVKVGGEADERRRRIEEKVAQLLTIGATVAERLDRPEGFWVVLRDPESDEFCVL